MKSLSIKLGFLILLIVANIALFFGIKGDYSLSYEPDRFSVKTNLEKISIINNAENISLGNANDGWILNESFDVDPSILTLFQRIMSNVQVRRPVEVVESDNVIKVELYGLEENINFKVWGNETKTKTYFSDESGVYEMEIPGYRDYLAGIFELKMNQWRNREIFSGNWRTIQKLEIIQESTLSIRFDDNFYLVDGIAALDSNSIVDYLNQYEHLQVNEIVTQDQIPTLDEIIQEAPLATIVIESIDYNSEKKIIVYPKKDDQPYHVIRTENDLTAVVDARRITNLLVSPSYFQFKAKTE